MLFNSYAFIAFFVPVTILVYFLIRKLEHPRVAMFWLVLASLVFYGSYNVIYVGLICSSILINYLLGIKLRNSILPINRKLFFSLGLSFNILLLGYFKYANFFIENVNAAAGTSFSINAVVLPLAISFFTITQIAYLFDTYRGQIDKHGLLEYTLFISFFPKLLSGPITRFKEIVPQLHSSASGRFSSEQLAVGITIFFLGLLKKLLFADALGTYANYVFDAAAQGVITTFFVSWQGALAYTFQLYFDFSGYCDMAIGLGLIFGVRLPLNFYSPYKATSLIDFWRRWHMTLSSFIRDYIYIPLGGNRKGFYRQIFNLLVAMTIAGLWHGAGWTFIVWGALHGFYLAINHCWRKIKTASGLKVTKAPLWTNWLSIVLTFIAVTVAWVFFRADNVSSAWMLIKGMAGLNGVTVPVGLLAKLGVAGRLLQALGVSFASQTVDIRVVGCFWILISFIICWFLPNSQEYMSKYQPSLLRFSGETPEQKRWSRWVPSPGLAVVTAVIIVADLLVITQVTSFIYIQF